MLKNAIWLFIISVLVLFVFLPSYTQLQDLKKRNFEFQNEIERLQTERTELVEERRLLEDDPVYLEKVARQKMGLIREGEVVYKIMPMNKEK